MSTTFAPDAPSLGRLFSYNDGIANSPVAPWSVNGMAAATNGQLFVVLKKWDQPLIELPQKYAKAVEFATKPMVDAIEVSDTALREFVGPYVAPKLEECEECYGSGYSGETFVCEHCDRNSRTECEACEGLGHLGPIHDIDPVLIVGIEVDRCQLAYALAIVPCADALTVGALPVSTGHRALCVETPAWRIVLMCLINTTAKASFPRSSARDGHGGDLGTTESRR